jgi:predicted CoA-binding protein
MDWQANLITSDADIRALIAQTKRIAVLGIRSERLADQPVYAVPAYLARAGFEIIPVPVYERQLHSILGQRVYLSLAEIPGPIDLVDVFRLSEDIGQHVDDILAKRPRAVWFQLGIRNDVIAARLAQAGILVVQDRCLMVEHRRALRS